MKKLLFILTVLLIFSGCKTPINETNNGGKYLNDSYTYIADTYASLNDSVLLYNNYEIRRCVILDGDKVLIIPDENNNSTYIVQNIDAITVVIATIVIVFLSIMLIVLFVALVDD